LAAKDTYDTLAAYQKELQTPALKSVRSAAESFRRRFEDLRTEWQTFRRDDHESAARINWHAAYNSNLRVSNATGSPPDVIDAILSKLEHFMTEQTLEFTPMRRDSNNVWRESMSSLVLFCHHEAGWRLQGNFIGDFYPGEFAKNGSALSGDAEDQSFPIPKHQSQWFLFDCMRYIDEKAANTRVLQSLLKSDWMPDGPAIPEIDGADRYASWRRRRQGRRKSLT